jgi:phospholipid transport system transporter-binding protein
MLLLPETLTMREARDAVRMLGAALQRQAAGDDLVVDASALKRFDSSALAVLLESARLAQAWGKRLRVQQAPPQLAELARLYGVDELLLA